MYYEDGFSIITCNCRFSCIVNLITNFITQEFPNKELILIINNDDINIDDFNIYTDIFKNINVFKLPQSTNLGVCLNFAVSKCRYKYIAKFDDDDFYSKYYLSEMYDAFINTNSDFVGKWQYYIYLEGSNKLLARPNVSINIRQNRYLKWLPGATICFKKEVFDKIEFSDVNKHVDDDIMKKANDENMSIYTTTIYNFMAFRHMDINEHTWQITHEKLEESCMVVNDNISFEDAKKYIMKKF